MDPRNDISELLGASYYEQYEKTWLRTQMLPNMALIKSLIATWDGFHSQVRAWSRVGNWVSTSENPVSQSNF